MQPNAIAPRTRPPFRRSLALTLRVIWALVMREVLTRYGRHNIGFLWLFFEPMLFTLGVTVMWSLGKGSHSSTMAMVPFALTGYSAVLLWRNTAGRCPKAIDSNSSLMHHRNVKVLDIFLARIFLELVGCTMSFALLTCVFATLELAPWPSDVVGLAMAWLALAGFATGLGLCIGALSEQSELVDKLWHTFTYLLFPFSGAMFMVDWMPTNVQNMLLVLPMVHATEWVRHAYFGPALRTHEQPLYLLAWDLVLLAVGLIMAQRVARRVEPE